MFVNLNNFEIKLEAVKERTLNLQRGNYLECFKHDLEYKTVFQQVGTLFKMLNWKGFGSQFSTLL